MNLSNVITYLHQNMTDNNNQHSNNEIPTKYFDPIKYSTHHISDLIELLTNIESTKGNLPIVYWDQSNYIKMDNEYLVDILQGNNQNFLAFGGFHVNGIDFSPNLEWDNN